jgi:hypothetical protein
MQKKLLTFQPGKKHVASIQLWRHYQQLFNQQQTSEASYPKWLKERENKLLKKQSHITTSLKFTVVIDISTNNSPQSILSSLHSLKAQTYPNWELILVTAGANLTTEINNMITQLKSNVSKVLDLSKFKKPLKIHDLLQISTGQYLFHLESSTVASKYTLSILARFINSHNTIDIIYADHDTIDNNGIRSNPIFKPDFNLDLLLSNNYIGESIAISNKLLSAHQNLQINSHSLWLYELLIHSALNQISIHHISLILTHSTPRLSEPHKTEGQLYLLKKYLTPNTVNILRGKTAETFELIVGFDVP